ncbi:hypothetical protein W97_05665 [Coniosporium apollinis CBS 100218]|uniref:Uncharacterized protein n=1 Tax=Coniosporium apollinis (strain CBS 100218) TaxID=1168221 RepID=R7YWI9_CONA1|nr:uncharacterized protein W97_05665 [Coniosporium apollinis CBS 100218]EON66272.1 hypothetical protein W97_05665 [Coniosporium apollinis CBS 100218]
MAFYAPVDNIPDPHYPIDPLGIERRWLIEAPINSVEVLEAILKPAVPYKVHQARPIRQYRPGPLTQSEQNLQDCRNRLFLDREVSFVILGFRECYRLSDWFEKRGFWSPPFSQFTIPWFSTKRGKYLSPVEFALFSEVSDHTRANGLTRESATRAVLEELGLLGQSLSRSLLPHGAVALPENSTAWIKGRPGTTSEYTASAEQIYEARRSHDQKHRPALSAESEHGQTTSSMCEAILDEFFADFLARQCQSDRSQL